MNILVTILFFLVVGIISLFLIPVMVALSVVLVVCVILHAIITRFNDVPRTPGRGKKQ
jgi:hypothetical protein